MAKRVEKKIDADSKTTAALDDEATLLRAIDREENDEKIKNLPASSTKVSTLITKKGISTNNN